MTAMTIRRAALAALTGLFVPALAACGGGGPTQSTAPCPPASILGDANQVTFFEPATSTKIEDIVMQARLTDIELVCRGKDTVTIAAFVLANAVDGEKPPSGATPKLELFVAVVDGNTVKDKKSIKVQPFIKTRESWTSVEKLPSIKIPRDQIGGQRPVEIVVGIALTEDQYAYNVGKRGR